jgi:hypothetical protein
MKSEREKQNLLKWIDFYTEQIKDVEKKLYLNSLKTYVNTSSTQQSQPSFKSLDEYFKCEKEQGKILLFIFLFIL